MPLRQQHQHLSRQAEPYRPADLVRGADAAGGSEVQPLDRPAQPLGRARGGPEGEKREPLAQRQIECDLGRSAEDQLVLGDQHHGPVGALRQIAERGKGVVEPEPGEAEPDVEPRPDMGQAFAEIGAVLLGDAVQARRADRRRPGRAQAVHVADHRLGHQPEGKRPVAAAIGRHQRRRQRQRRVQIRRLDRAAAKQGHPAMILDNVSFHAMIDGD